jgi:hypothetical protein
MSENMNENYNTNTDYNSDNTENNPYKNNYDYTVSISESTAKATSLTTKIIAGICGFVVGAGAVIGVSYAVSDSVKNTLRLNFTSKKSYYAWVERKNSALLAENIADISKTSKNITDISLSVTPNAGLNQMLPLLGVTNLQSASLDYSIPEDNYTDLTLNINDSDILTLALYEDKKGNTYITLPQISDSYLMSSKDSATDETSENQEENVFNSLGNYFDYANNAITAGKEIKKYTKLVSSDVKNVKIDKSQEVTVNSCNYKFNNINISLTGDEVKNILTDVKEEISSDDDLKDLCSAYLSVTDSDFDVLTDSIDDIYNSVDSADTYSITIYVNSKGVICGRELTVLTADTQTENTLTYFYINQNNKININLSSSDSGNILSGIASKSDDIYTGTFNYGDEDSDTVSITFNDLKVTEKKNMNYLDGVVNISSSDYSSDITFSSEDNKQSASFDIIVDDTNYATVKLDCITNSKSDKEEKYIPSDDSVIYDSSVDSEYQQFINEIDIDEIQTKIYYALGLSSAIIGSNDYSSYDDLDDSDYSDDLDDIYSDDSDDGDDDFDWSDYYDYDNDEDDYNDYFFESDLSSTDIKYNGISIQQGTSNIEIAKLFGVDTSQTIDAYDSSDMFYDDTENNYICYWNSSADEKSLSQCNLYTLYADEDAGVDFSVNGITFGASYDDIIKAFNIEGENSSSSLLQIYDEDGLYEITFYLFDGKVTSIEYYDYN